MIEISFCTLKKIGESINPSRDRYPRWVDETDRIEMMLCLVGPKDTKGAQKRARLLDNLKRGVMI